MRPELQAGVLLVTGIVVVRLVLTGGHVNYLRPGMAIPLVAAGALLALVGAGTLVAGGGDTGDVHGHSSRSLRVGLLLIIPVLAVALIPPAPLGAYAAGLKTGPPPVAQSAVYPPLPEPVDGAVPLTLSEFVGRAYYDTERSLDGVAVRLTGFVNPDADSAEGFLLSRFVVGCCAADARPVSALVLEAGPAPPTDTWLEVVGTWRPSEGRSNRIEVDPPQLIASSVRRIPGPAIPYES